MKKNYTYRAWYDHAFKKTFLVMRLVLVISLVCIMQSFAMDSYTQNSKISISVKEMKLDDILLKIESETNYRFAYNKTDINVNQGYTIDISDGQIKEVLDKLFADKDISYKIIDQRQIILSKSNRAYTISQQPKSISGLVTDSSRTPLPGVTVVIKGTTIGTITNFDGVYTLPDVPSNATIQFSFVGMKTQEIATGGKTNINVTLEEETIGLEEVVAIGYGTQRKGNLATAITSVKSEILENRSVKSVGEALQGQVSGLSVTSSGRPGQAPTIVLRGATSLNGVGSPLVLVDGVASDFNYLNPDDIESINVLKDAASAAIYGSRGANGVILVTTKRGKLGKPTFRYNGSIGVNTPTAMPVTCSSAIYADVINKAETNMGRTAPYTNADIELFRNGTDPNRYPNTDWLDLAIQNSLTTRHAIEASGGSESVKYFVSAGLDHQTGVFADNTQDVFNVRSNTDIAVSKKFNISFDLRFQMRKLSELNNVDDAYNRILAANPAMVAYYTDGTYGYNAGFFINPLVDIYESGHTYTDNYDASGILKIEYEILDGLKFTGLGNTKYVFNNIATHVQKLYYKDFFTQKEYVSGSNNSSENRGFDGYYNLQALLNYEKELGKHSIYALVGYQQENENYNWISAGRNGYQTNSVWALDAGPKTDWSNAGSGNHWSIASVISRLNYDYAKKYLLSASFRSDGSSRFTKGNRWSTFPSVAVAWRISEEPFIKKLSNKIDDLKIRASWGETGSSTGLGLYPSYTTISSNAVVLNNTWIQTAQLGTIGNTELTWERTKMLDFGLDFKTLNSRLGLTGDYYIKTTNDILIGLPVPLEWGFGTPPVNIGKMENRGWEVEVSWRDHLKDFKYEVSANLSDNKNEVLDLGGTGPWITGYTDVGLPFNSLYGYESLGLFQSMEEVNSAPFQNSNNRAGDVRYKDQNDDNKIDANDRVVIGDPYPHYLFGIRLGANYKGFDILMLFQGVGKKDLIMNDRSVRPLNDTPIFENQLDYWSPENTDAKYPRILNKTDAEMNYQVSDFWKINAGYLRIKNLKLGYSLPKNIIEPIGFTKVRAYCSINNLFTISNFIPGWDPEVSNALTYPFSRTYSFGLNIQL